MQRFSMVLVSLKSHVSGLHTNAMKRAIFLPVWLLPYANFLLLHYLLAPVFQTFLEVKSLQYFFVYLLLTFILFRTQLICLTANGFEIYFSLLWLAVILIGHCLIILGNFHYQNGGILLLFLSSSKTLPLVIAYGNLTRRYLVEKNYTKFWMLKH